METTSAFSLKPIGYMKSVFHFKNGTPRQSSLCKNARGILTVEKSVFNNPEHSLDGLQEFSHAWILFVFHKNNNAHKKAKVKPPRLDGQRVGVFSTRSPYRPNNIGLSLAKIDKIEGASIHFSGIDILNGTPVIDIKPYIPDYDKPVTETKSHQREYTEISTDSSVEETSSTNLKSFSMQTEVLSDVCSNQCSSCFLDSKINSESLSSPNIESMLLENPCKSVEEGFSSLSLTLDRTGARPQQGVEECVQSGDCDSNSDSSVVNRLIESGDQRNDERRQNNDKGDDGDDDDNILDSLVGDVICRAASDVFLNVKSNMKKTSASCDISDSCHDNRKPTKITQQRETTTKDSDSISNSAVTAPWITCPPVTKVHVVFSAEALQQLQNFHSNATDPCYRTEMLTGPDDAKDAITSILHEEPRSVYRRQKCQNSVYFFAVDVLHVTCWFDGDAVTVLRIKPAADVPQLQEKGAIVKNNSNKIVEMENKL